MAEQQSLIEFPCLFPIKIMGDTRDDFTSTMIEVIQPLSPKFDSSSIEMRGSTGGKYISITCYVQVDSKDQLDDIYRALSAHPMVKFVL